MTLTKPMGSSSLPSPLLEELPTITRRPRGDEEEHTAEVADDGATVSSAARELDRRDGEGGRQRKKK